MSGAVHLCVTITYIQNNLMPNSHTFLAVTRKLFPFIFGMLNYLRWSVAQFISFNSPSLFHLLCVFLFLLYLRRFVSIARNSRNGVWNGSAIGNGEKSSAILIFLRNWILLRIFAYLWMLCFEFFGYFSPAKSQIVIYHKQHHFTHKLKMSHILDIRHTFIAHNSLQVP